jgi:glycosyltransferase 2 family protein
LGQLAAILENQATSRRIEIGHHLFVNSNSTSTRRSLVWTLRIAALLIVFVGVGGTVRSALAQLSKHEWHVRPAWLVASSTLYVLGLMPMGWFWRRTLAALRYPTPFLAAMRAYFLGHLGKYVPGKAMAVILRVAAVHRWVPSMRIALISVLLETLTMMGVGAFLAFVLAVAVLRTEAFTWLVALGMALAAGVPTLPPVARWLARLGVGRYRQADSAKPPAMDLAEVESKVRGINVRLLVEGWIAAGLCWVLLALSLWSVLRAIGVEQLQPFSDLPRLITVVAFSVVAGFMSMLPGGIVVRDLILTQLLLGVCDGAQALVAAVLMRLVWLVSELVACGILYIAAGSGDKEIKRRRLAATR